MASWRVSRLPTPPRTIEKGNAGAPGSPPIALVRCGVKLRFGVGGAEELSAPTRAVEQLQLLLRRGRRLQSLQPTFQPRERRVGIPYS